VIGLTMMPFALWNYLQARRAIDAEQYYPAFWGIIIFTVAMTALGLIAVIYLLLLVINNPSVSGTAFSGDRISALL
jgi:uncharacterized membrane protein YidH (DUF202 family)